MMGKRRSYIRRAYTYVKTGCVFPWNITAISKDLENSILSLKIWNFLILHTGISLKCMLLLSEKLLKHLGHLSKPISSIVHCLDFSLLINKCRMPLENFAFVFLFDKAVIIKIV